MKERIHNHANLRVNRKTLRNNSTAAESILWTRLKSRQLKGRKFRRQHSIGHFIVDFYCAEENLAIEVDGGIHDDYLRANYDADRQQALEDLGIWIIRVENKSVIRYLDEVVEFISDQFGG